MRKHIVSIIKKYLFYLCLPSVTSILVSLQGMSAQGYSIITGKIADKVNNESIPYANVGLFSVADLKPIQGLISDTSGYFVFSNVHSGEYILKISMIGYDQVTREIDIPGDTRYDAGTFLMNQNTINLSETIITADRLKGKSEKDRTAYFITRQMAESSSNGLDIIRMIPGIQVDLMRNISLDGSQQILVLVDGKERDRNFVSQIIPDHIEKVEILNTPPAGYDGNITGVMNIVLKKEKQSGINGQINLEIPVSSSLYYIHPDYSLNFAYKKLNFFTSYNGEMIHFDQHESILRRIRNGEHNIETRSDQYVVQKLWSHRFHYGIDYFINPKTRINFYAFYNPFSQEYDGRAMAVSEMNNLGQWQSLRNTSDLNRSTFYSLYLKHTFSDRGGEITIDLSNYNLTGENVVTYSLNSDGSTDFENASKLFQNAVNLKADLNIPLGHNITMSSGARIRTYGMQDRTLEDFRYSGDVFSVYTTFSQTLSDFDWKLGMRVEKSLSDLRQVFRKHFLSLLPSASLNYKISSDRSLKFAVSNTVNRPSIYQLNPNISTDDPYSIRRGSPFLDPEVRTAISLEYSWKFKSNFGSIRLFYNRTGKSINSMTFLNDTSVYETVTNNYGTLHQTGFQFTGTFKAGSIITIIPYLRLYAQFTHVNRFAEEYSLVNRSQIVVEPGFSSLISLKYNFNIGMTFQYGSPRNNVSGNSYSDPLYLISLDKTFKNRIKIGIVSILPFTRTFTYQGSELKTHDFYYRYTGDIQLSKSVFSFKLSYQFTSGRKHEASIHSMDDIETVPRKGF